MEALYALKKYLEDLAFAGIHGHIVRGQQYQCIWADLKRFENSSPVIGKITSSLERLCSDESDNPEDKRLFLLKILELVNSVLYTQGEVYVEGSFIPLLKGRGESLDIPYADFGTVIDALSYEGSGREQVLSDIFDNHPELFKDYRIQRILVYAIADEYKPVYRIVSKIIVHYCGEFIPRMSELFLSDNRPYVKKRIIETIGRISCIEANQWLKSQLVDSNKEYRVDIISALSNFEENQDYLIELSKTEKRNALKAVINGLRVDRDVSLNALKEVFSVKNRTEEINLMVLSKIVKHYQAEQNEWYLMILKSTYNVKCKTSILNIRKAIIRVLKYSDENIDLLTELAGNEQEPCRDEVLADLLYFDSEKAQNVWDHELMTCDYAFQKLYEILNTIDNEYVKNTGNRFRPLLSRLYNSIKLYGTEPNDPYPVQIMAEMPVITKKTSEQSSLRLKPTQEAVEPEEVSSRSDEMYKKLKDLAGGTVFGALKSIFNHKGTLTVANTVLNKVTPDWVESERGQNIISVAHKFIADQNEHYQRDVVDKYQFHIDPDDPWSWCLGQLESAKGERLKFILRKTLDYSNLPCCTDALIHSIYLMQPGIERRHILLSILLYMHTQKANDYWVEEIRSNRESRLRLNIILRNVSNGRFLRSYFDERDLNRKSVADDLLSRYWN